MLNDIFSSNDEEESDFKPDEDDKDSNTDDGENSDQSWSILLGFL